MIDLFVLETNRYADKYISENSSAFKPFSKVRAWRAVEKDEMHAFIGMLLNMGLVRKPSIESYFWESYFSQQTPGFKVMSLDRFKLLLRFFHVSDFEQEKPRSSPDYDPLYKFRDVFEIINKNFQEAYALGQDISIDESIIGFKGRHILVQYTKIKKHHQWGPKIYVLADAKTGYSYRLMFHTKQAQNSNKGQPYNVCMELLQAENRNKKHHLGIDNYYTSVALCEDLFLSGVYVTGTVRQNRVGLPLEMKQNMKQKGQFVCFRKGPLLAVNIRDRNCVRLLSTYSTARVTEKSTRGVVSHMPSIITHYNRVMGGADLADQMVQEYAAELRTRKLSFAGPPVCQCLFVISTQSQCRWHQENESSCVYGSNC